MLLSITTTNNPATDLGFLLHKNPARPQPFKLSFGHAHIFYREASDERFTRREPFRRVHKCVFGALALESNQVDPRL